MLGTTAAVPSPASAFHSDEERWLDTTAYNLRGREFRLGMLKWSAGIIDQVTISMYTLPWIITGILRGWGPNVEVQYMFYDRKGLTLSLRAAVFYGNPEQDNGVRVRYLDVPVTFATSYRINDTWSVHGDINGSYANVFAGETQDDQEIQGTLVASQVHLAAMVELRVSKVTAFTLTGRYLPWISDAVVDGQVDASDVSTLFFDLQFAFEDFKNAWNIVAAANFSWKVVNLSVGIGYGDYFIPGMALVIPGPIPVPQFDLFFRF